MPDHIDPIAAEGTADWPGMMHDLEKKVEVLSDALEGVKLAMRRLVMAEPWIEQAIEAVAPAHSEPHVEEHLPFMSLDAHPLYQPAPAQEEPSIYGGPEPVQDATPAYHDERPVYQDAPSAHYDEPSVYEHGHLSYVDEPKYEPQAPAPQPAAAAYDEDAREAVRRAVEEAKAQMASGQLREEPQQAVSEERPDVSWIPVPSHGTTPEPRPVFDEQVEPARADETPTSEEDPREAVRRAVEQARAELGNQGSHASPIEPVEDPPSHPASTDDEAARDAVRQAVEQARAELSMQDSRPPVEPSQNEHASSAFDDEAAREAVRQAVEQAKAERAFEENAVGTLSEEEAAREAVRQAVLKARTEMATTGTISEQEPEPVARKPAFVVPPPHRPERIHPPTLTIEDPESRVELARVYNLLKHLDVAANSSLLNYSSRQVSVQLGDSKTPPDDTEVSAAVHDVFERESDVSVDGLNVIVRLGSDLAQAA